MELVSNIKFIVFAFFLNSVLAHGQSVFEQVDSINYPYRLWDEQVIAACNTASASTTLSKEEKDLIWLTNLARFDPPLFAKTFLKEYIEKNNIDIDANVKSLFSDMKSIRRLSILICDDNVCSLAKDYALWSGKNGKVGHYKFDERTRKSKHSRFGENCQYGLNTAMAILVELLIDRNVKGVGHRKNILNPYYTHIGVSIAPHVKEEYVCVMDFGG